MGAGRALPDLAARGRRSAHAAAARGVRRPALHGSLRRTLARAAERPAAVARGLRPGPALAARRLLRDAGARPESGARAVWDGHTRTRSSMLHLAVDTLGHLLALRVTPADANDRAAVAELAEAVRDATGGRVEIAYVDEGYTGD